MSCFSQKPVRFLNVKVHIFLLICVVLDKINLFHSECLDFVIIESNDYSYNQYLVYKVPIERLYMGQISYQQCWFTNGL